MGFRTLVQICNLRYFFALRCHCESDGGCGNRLRRPGTPAWPVESPAFGAATSSFKMIHRIQFEQLVPDSIEKVFRFFADPNDLPRIMPPKTGTELTALRLLPPPTAAEFPIVNRLLARARRLQPPFACCPFFLSAQNGSPQLPNSNGTPLRRYTEKRTVQTISASPRVAKHAKVVPSRVCLLTFENPLFEVAGESEPPVGFGWERKHAIHR